MRPGAVAVLGLYQYMLGLLALVLRRRRRNRRRYWVHPINQARSVPYPIVYTTPTHYAFVQRARLEDSAVLVGIGLH